MSTLEILRRLRDQAFLLFTARQATVDVDDIQISLDGVSARMRYILYRGYEAKEARFAKRFLECSDTVIEAGSAIGFMALYCHKHIGINNYLMIEANPELLPMIRENFLLNSVNLPKLLHAAVTGEDRNVEFGISSNFWSSSIYERAKEKRRIDVKGLSLPTILAQLEFSPNTLIMDIEGSEVDIPAEHFSVFKKVIIELHPEIVGLDRTDMLINSLQKGGFGLVEMSGGVHFFEKIE